MENKSITVSVDIDAPIDKVWRYFTEPEYILKWNAASPDWHTTAASNNLSVGGNFSYTMAAKDGSFSFDFGGTYDHIKDHEEITYTLADGRNVEVIFNKENFQTKIVQTFEPEDQNPLEMQRGGWQAILENFKKFVEAQ